MSNRERCLDRVKKRLIKFKKLSVPMEHLLLFCFTTFSSLKHLAEDLINGMILQLFVYGH